jgi:hypothetical protein
MPVEEAAFKDEDRTGNRRSMLQKLSFGRNQWGPIAGAPKDGRVVTLGWLSPKGIELEVSSRWVNGGWEGNWTPRHWRPYR